MKTEIEFIGNVSDLINDQEIVREMISLINFLILIENWVVWKHWFGRRIY